jgi:hypothetical protein
LTIPGSIEIRDMIGQEPVKKNGRPKKQRITLDTSMSPEQAKEQNVIATAKEKMYKAEIQRVKALEANKSVIDTKVVSGIVNGVFSTLKTILYSATNKLPAQLAGKEHAEINRIMFEFIDESLKRMQEDFDNKLSNLTVTDEDEEEDIEDD